MNNQKKSINKDQLFKNVFIIFNIWITYKKNPDHKLFSLNLQYYFQLYKNFSGYNKNKQDS